MTRYNDALSTAPTRAIPTYASTGTTVAPRSARIDLEAAVLDLLLMQADAIIEGDAPDLLLDYRTYSRHTRQTCAAEIAALVEAADADYVDAVADAATQHERRRLALARALYLRYAEAPMRFDLALVPKDLRKWATEWLKEAAKAFAVKERRQKAKLARVFIYLTLRDCVEWEQAQTESCTLDDLVTASFGDARGDGVFDGGPITDTRPVHAVGESYRFLKVA